MDVYKSQLKFDSEKELKKEKAKIEAEEDPEIKEKLIAEQYTKSEEKKHIMEGLVAKIDYF